ncbi:hypothetical protein MB02_12215 [Croceicoccus estronivorus]|uniref:helix-turn-helix domain-containing protein n=1 Tax=Croceicoccus estronivorus TaxID=1172626 RepID=UPI00083663A6|nr:AraC family transcriptional regulator [Croceicoccus estronivorus]OCC23376.1 hypothetical protein MB02_12215 [Croceicoccus estronivorus]
MPTGSGQTQTYAQFATEQFVIELAQNKAESPCDLIIGESDNVVAMQRQRLQTFSTGRFETGGQTSDYVNIGRIMALPAGWPLHVRAEGGLTDSVRCIFTAETLERITGRTTLIAPQDALACLNIRSPHIAQTLTKLAAEVENPGPLSPAMIDALGTTVIIELTRHLADTQRPGGLHRGGLARRTLRQVCEYIDNRNGAVTLSELSRVTTVSERHLSRAFKESTGQTLSQYMAEVRLKRAMELLAGTSALIKDIAEKIGFGSAGTFCVFFARATGETPGDFRRRVQSDAARE